MGVEVEMASAFSSGLGVPCFISMRIGRLSPLSSLRDGEQQQAKAPALSCSFSDPATWKMTAVTFFQFPEESKTHNIEESFDGAGWWISTPDFPAVPVPPTAQRAGCWDGSVMQKVCAFSVLVLMLCVWWGLCGAMDERAGLLIQRFRVRVPAEMITWHVPLLFWMLSC